MGNRNGGISNAGSLTFKDGESKLDLAIDRLLCLSYLGKKHNITAEGLLFLSYHGIDTITHAVDHRWSMEVPHSLVFTNLGQAAMQELASKRLLNLTRACAPLLAGDTVSPSRLWLTSKGCDLLNAVLKDASYNILAEALVDSKALDWYNDNDPIKHDCVVNRQ